LQAQRGRYQRLLDVSANITPSTETLGWLNHAIALQQTDSPIKRLANSVRDARNRLVNVRSRLIEAPVADVVDRSVNRTAKIEHLPRSVFAAKVPAVDREEPMDVVEGRPPGASAVEEVDEAEVPSPPASPITTEDVSTGEEISLPPAPATSHPRRVLTFCDSDEEIDEAAE